MRPVSLAAMAALLVLASVARARAAARDGRVVGLAPIRVGGLYHRYLWSGAA